VLGLVRIGRIGTDWKTFRVGGDIWMHTLVLDPGREFQLIIFDTPRRLSGREERLLMALCSDPQHVISHERCYLAIYGDEVVEPGGVADVVTQLRQKGVPIVTVHRRGYMLAMPASEVHLGALGDVDNSGDNLGDTVW